MQFWGRDVGLVSMLHEVEPKFYVRHNGPRDVDHLAVRRLSCVAGFRRREQYFVLEI